MAAVLVTTAYGDPAARQLHQSLVAAKRHDPLAPVAVVVPTNSVGVATRRLLAGGAFGTVSARGEGLVGVTFLTVLRLAELVAAPRLAASGRRPVATPVVAAAVRQELAQRPGIFAGVSAHPATEESLVRAHRELADLDDDRLDVLAGQSLRAHDVVRVHRAVTDRLREHWYAERDLMDAGTDVVTDATIPVDLDAVVVYLPQSLSTPAARFLRAIAEAVDTTVILGCTGDARADAAVLASAGRLGVKVDDARRAAITPATGTAVLDASDPDDEVRAVVRAVVAAMRDGVPLEQMSVTYASADPYARLLHEHLELAGIAHNGASVRTLRDCALGGALVRLLSWPEDGYRRDDLFALFAGAPVLDGSSRTVPATRWERISRRAGIVGGRGEWGARLDHYIASIDPDDGRFGDRAGAEGLRDFAARLVADLDPESVPPSWSGKCRWAHNLIARYFGREPRRAAWPAFEQEAARRVELVLDRLVGLDEVERAPSLDVFRRTFELELAGARDRVGRLGDGLLVGPVALTLGTDLEQLFVCGLAEGMFPAVTRDDPLLSDRERSALDGELALRADRADDDHRALLAALASTRGARTLSFGRGDLRRSTDRVPSRYLEPTSRVHSGYSDLRAAGAGQPWRTTIASYVDGLTRTTFPANRHEHDVRAMLSGVALADAPQVARGLEMLDARRSGAFTRFDGNLGALAPALVAAGPTADGVAISPTQLETWARCPHAYFVQYVLGVRAVERPEEILQLTPIDRGNVIHEILDRFVGEGGTAADHVRLHEITDEASAGVEARGLAGRRLLWERDRRLVHAHLDAWLDADDAGRDAYGLTTLHTESVFRAVPVQLRDGRSVRFNGAIDRVDRAATGHIVVFDYKTGSPTSYTAIGEDDPVTAGTHLQLPIYARVARALFGEPGAPAEAYYWFVGRGNNRWIGYEVTPGVDAVFDAALQVIVEGIEAGCFVARPVPPGPRPWVDCHFCDPDGLGTSDRWHEWERKVADPALEVYLALGDLLPGEVGE